MLLHVIKIITEAELVISDKDVMFVLGIGFDLSQIVSVDSFNDQVSKTKIFFSLHSMVMCWRWLIDGPVVERWIPYWILGF